MNKELKKLDPLEFAELNTSRRRLVAYFTTRWAKKETDHNVHRARLHDSVLEILVPYDMQNFINNTDLYLYGHSSLSQSENKNILLSTIKFINESNRFAKHT